MGAMGVMGAMGLAWLVGPKRSTMYGMPGVKGECIMRGYMAKGGCMRTSEGGIGRGVDESVASA